MRKATVHWNISENQVIFCGHANHKQCYEVRKSSIFCLIASLLVAEGPSSSKISARSANKWSCDSCGRHAVPGLYYVMYWLVYYFILWPSMNVKKPLKLARFKWLI